MSTSDVIKAAFEEGARAATGGMFSSILRDRCEEYIKSARQARARIDARRFVEEIVDISGIRIDGMHDVRDLPTLRFEVMKGPGRNRSGILVRDKMYKLTIFEDGKQTEFFGAANMWRDQIEAMERLLDRCEDSDQPQEDGA